jgi:exosortase/archaeosortase family protein
MKKDKKIISKGKIYFILLRYLILLALMFSLPLLYKVLTPLTLYPVTTLLKIFFNNVTLIMNNTGTQILIINLKTFIKIIPACIAGSAYLLLLILNLTVSMNLQKRVYTLLSSFLILLLLNIIRITIFSSLFCYNFTFFDFTHKLLWYFLSTIFVIAVWFFIVKIFSIKEIPVYSDIKTILKLGKIR